MTSPDRYDEVLAALDAHGRIDDGLRAALAVEAFRHTAAYDARIAEVLPGRMAAAGVALPDEPGLPGATDPYPASLTIALEKVETLRYGENPHQPAARYRRPGSGLDDGPFATGAPPLQGKALSYNNVLDAAAAAAIGRALRGPGVRHRQAHQPVRRRRASDRSSTRGTPRSRAIPCRAFGGVVALTRPVDAAAGRGASSRSSSRSSSRPASTPTALAILAAKPNLRLVVDPRLGPTTRPRPPPDPTGSIRTAGGAVLVTPPTRSRTIPATWTVATPPQPDRRRAARPRPRLAARPRRDLERDRPRPRRPADRDGSGQTSRVDAARGAVAKAQRDAAARTRWRAPRAPRTRSIPFPDAVEVCLDAGVTAFVQPGGSVRDAERSPPSMPPAPRCS